MQPMGRQHFQGNRSKHSTKSAGKTYSWWAEICIPSNKRERQQVRRGINKEVVAL